MNSPLVSIIIPAFNEQEVIGDLLQSIKKQTYSKIETLVIDDASTDDTVEICKRNQVKVFKRSHQERSIQRNFGAKMASGKYLLFLDADMILEPNVIADCVKTMTRDASVGMIIIPEIPVASTFWEKAKAFERNMYNEFGDNTTDAARFFSKTAFLKSGGYDTNITGPEDWDLPETISKLGFLSKRISNKIYHHERIRSPFQVAKKKYYYALSSHIYFKKHNISIIGPKTIYFLRPVFYKNWKKFLKHPVVGIGMIFLVTLEQIFGLAGYILGKYKK